MTATRLLNKTEIEKRLRPYRCRFIEILSDGTEVWETGWHHPFTLMAEPETDGLYDEWQYQRVIATVVAQTMPPDWFNTTEI